jgi:uncharacterized protein (DUF305 family)
MRPLVLGILLAGCAGSEPDNAANTVPVTAPPMSHDAKGDDLTAKTPADATYDQMFVDHMIAHHQGGVEMAAMADLRAEHPELKTFAATLHDGQQLEIRQLRDLRKSWYGSPEAARTPPNDDMPGSKSLRRMELDLQTLNTTKTFDRDFLDAMIAHHEGAVEMATDAQSRAEHAELKDMAGKMIADQTKEIEQMRSWRSSWYPERNQ